MVRAFAVSKDENSKDEKRFPGCLISVIHLFSQSSFYPSLLYYCLELFPVDAMIKFNRGPGMFLG